MQAGITILICTYNGAGRLPVTLWHIARQVMASSIPCEVIVVDNASVDNTSDLARQEWRKLHAAIPCEVIREDRPGLTFAREKGIAAANYEYILLCDDDNWLSESYVGTAFEVMQRHPSIGILGGLGQFEFEATPPAWFNQFNLYAGGPQAEASGPVPGSLVYGAGAVLRKTAFKRLQDAGFASLLTDRLGYQLSSGGDHELCYALALAGYSVWYDDRLRFRHFITANRLTPAYYRTYIKESSQCFSVLEPYKILLKTGSTSLPQFRKELLKSLGYHGRKITRLVISMAIHPSADKDNSIAQRLELLMLRQRLFSYRYFKTMQRNFQRAARLKDLFNQTQIPASRLEQCDLPADRA